MTLFNQQALFTLEIGKYFKTWLQACFIVISGQFGLLFGYCTPLSQIINDTRVAPSIDFSLAVSNRSFYFGMACEKMVWNAVIIFLF